MWNVPPLGFSQCFSCNWTVVIGFLSNITEVNAIFITYQGYTLSTRLLTVGVDLIATRMRYYAAVSPYVKYSFPPFPTVLFEESHSEQLAPSWGGGVMLHSWRTE